MEVQTDIIKTDAQTFLDILSKYDEVRIALTGGDEPFEDVYIKADMADVKHTIDRWKMDVSYSIMYNSRVNPELKDNLYIHAMKMTII